MDIEGEGEGEGEGGGGKGRGGGGGGEGSGEGEGERDVEHANYCMHQPANRTLLQNGSGSNRSTICHFSFNSTYTACFVNLKAERKLKPIIQ